eukprot:6175786-Pleurochrysis_carterae.AAC.1
MDSGFDALEELKQKRKVASQSLSLHLPPSVAQLSLALILSLAHPPHSFSMFVFVFMFPCPSRLRQRLFFRYHAAALCYRIPYMPPGPSKLMSNRQERFREMELLKAERKAKEERERVEAEVPPRAPLQPATSAVPARTSRWDRCPILSIVSLIETAAAAMRESLVLLLKYRAVDLFLAMSEDAAPLAPLESRVCSIRLLCAVCSSHTRASSVLISRK